MPQETDHQLSRLPRDPDDVITELASSYSDPHQNLQHRQCSISSGAIMGETVIGENDSQSFGDDAQSLGTNTEIADTDELTIP